MKFSIITPSYNQRDYIGLTMDSVLLQKPVDFEYMVFDGNSNDGASDILTKRQSDIDYLSIEEDKGQAHAINKGFKRASGDIVAWINSDDKYLPGVFEKITNIFKDPKVMWVTGNCEVIDEAGKVIDLYETKIPDTYYQWLTLFIQGYSTALLQPPTFWRKEVMDRVGLLNEKFHFSFDHEFFFRILKEFGHPTVLDIPLAQFRLHSESKTMTEENRFKKENMKIGLMHAHKEPLKKKLYLYGLYLRARLRNA